MSDPRWSCLDSLPEPSTAAGPFRLSFQFVDLITMGPTSGVQASLCNKLDTGCQTPVAVGVSDAAGQINFMVARGFNGYMSAENGEAIAPVLYFVNPPVDRDQQVVQSVSSPQVAAGLRQQFGMPVLDDRGSVVITSQDCLGHLGAGVRYSSPAADASTFEFYIQQGLPTTTAAATDDTGAGGIVNLPLGSVAVVGTVAGHATPVATISVLTRAGFTSYTTMVPRAQ